MMDSDTNLLLQTILGQQQTIAQDMSALRSDVGKALTRIEIIDNRSSTAGTALSDHEARLRLLERFRYTIAGLSLVGGLVAGSVGYYLGHMFH